MMLFLLADISVLNGALWSITLHYIWSAAQGQWDRSIWIIVFATRPGVPGPNGFLFTAISKCGKKQLKTKNSTIHKTRR